VNLAAIAALILAGAGWGIGLPLGKVALKAFDPAHMVLLRFVAAGVAAAPFALATPQARRLFRSPRVIVAGVAYGWAFVMQFEGLARISVTLAALLVGVMPAMVAVCARLMGEPVSRLSWTGVVAATLGAMVMAGAPSGEGSPLGIALSLGSLVVFLGWVVALRRAPETESPMALPSAVIVVSTIAIVPVALILHGVPALHAPPAAWAAIAGQGLVSTLISTAAWQYGSVRVGSATAGVFINVEPLVGSALGVLVFHDRLTLALAAGGALILAGSLAVVLGERGRPKDDLAHAPATPG
jgi:drug/metabolite transporter (DMT)-like permease